MGVVVVLVVVGVAGREDELVVPGARALVCRAVLSSSPLRGQGFEGLKKGKPNTCSRKTRGSPSLCPMAEPPPLCPLH